MKLVLLYQTVSNQLFIYFITTRPNHLQVVIEKKSTQPCDFDQLISGELTQVVKEKQKKSDIKCNT